MKNLAKAKVNSSINVELVDTDEIKNLQGFPNSEINSEAVSRKRLSKNMPMSELIVNSNIKNTEEK